MADERRHGRRTNRTSTPRPRRPNRSPPRSRPSTPNRRSTTSVRLYTGTGAFRGHRQAQDVVRVSGAIAGHRGGQRIPGASPSASTSRAAPRSRCPWPERRGSPPRSRSRTCSTRRSGKGPESVVRSAAARRRPSRSGPETLTNSRGRQAAHAFVRGSSRADPDGQPSETAISDSAVSETWGDQITRRR